MEGCIYRTKDGECDLYSEGGKYNAWCDLENCDSRRPSNADRVRAMTDEELAYYLNNVETDGRVYGPRGEAYWLDRLRQEAHNDT